MVIGANPHLWGKGICDRIGGMIYWMRPRSCIAACIVAEFAFLTCSYILILIQVIPHSSPLIKQFVARETPPVVGFRLF